MNELKKFCKGCQKEVDIKEIIRDSQREILKFSCGHKHIKVTFTGVVKIEERISLKHKNEFGKLLERFKTKTSGKTKRPAKDSITIDRENRKIIHKVWEKNENEKWELVHMDEKNMD